MRMELHRYFGLTSKIVTVMCLLLFHLTGWALEHTPNSVKAISKAYGFILGQEQSLSRIERTYPDAAMQVELVRLGFNSTFPDIKKKLEAELVKALTQPKFKELQKELQEKIRQFQSKQQITPQLAEQFLGQVKARAKGEDMEPDVLMYLLAARYQNNPVAEFGNGFRQRYRTDGSGKSRGIRLVLQLPRSWLAKEGERPHIVQKWVSEGGTGNNIIMLDIRDAEGSSPTKADMEQFVKSGEVRELAPEGGKVVDAGVLAMEKRFGYWAEMTVWQERAGLRMYQRTFLYQLFIDGKAVVLMCMSGAMEGKESKADADAKLNKPLCQQVLNSLVLEQAY
jgi:hypothetical protein